MNRWSNRLQDRRLSARPAASRSRLPREIIDMIIDFLHLSPQSLSNCALVCNSWVPRVRRHQFRTLTIPGSQVSEFVELLSSPSSSLLACITTLQIGTEGSRWTPSRTIYEAISDLRRLKTLKLCYFDIVTKKVAELGTLRHTCHRLHVVIRNGLFREGYQFLQMLCLFSQAKRKSFSEVPLFAIKDIPKNCFSYMMEGTWRVEHETPPCFVEWVCMQNPVPSLNTLWLSSCGPAGGRLLKTVGKSLTEIRLMLRKFGPDGYSACRNDEKEFFQSIDLSHNPNLRLLKITDIFFESPESTPFLPILRLLGQIGSAPVTKLSFEVTFKQLTQLDQVPWELLRNVIEWRCTRLKKMTIALSMLDRTSRKRQKLTKEGKQEMEATVRGRFGGSIEHKLKVGFLDQ